MPKKTNTTAAQQRARQEQWRRRVDAQMGGQPTRPGSSAALDDMPTETGESGGGYQQASMRQMPTAVTTSSAGTRTPATRTTRPTSASMPTAGQRRTMANSRTARARIAVNTMSMEEEMHYVRADIRKLTVLTAACLVIIIVLALIINMM